MSILSGSDILLFTYDVSADEYIDLACQRNVTITMTSDNFETTCKQSEGWAEFGYGKRSFTISCDALIEFDTDGDTQSTLGTLFDFYENRTPVQITIANPLFTNEYFVGTCVIESLEANASMEDVATYTATLTGTADLTSFVS